MNRGLTDEELNAVLQLIQFRRDYYPDSKGAGNRVCMLNFPQKQEEENVKERAAESSDPEDALPRKKKRFRSIIDIYRNTKPLMDPKRAKNRICP